MTQLEMTDAYRVTVRKLSDRIVLAQAPIRILDSIKWSSSVQAEFFAKKCKELPAIDADYYKQKNTLGFDPVQKRQEFYELERDIVRLLGEFNPVGQIMRRMCSEYRQVIRLIESRGTREFANVSAELYGASSDAFHAGDPTIADLGVMMSESLQHIDRSMLVRSEEKTITAEAAVEILQARMDSHFSGLEEKKVRVLLNDGIVADAAAGADYIKIRREAMFNERDLKILEVHEGLVHIGTTLNGQSQPICTFLSKGPPSSTITQEGLAILMEILAFTSYPARLRKITNRIRAVRMAEEGANFLEVFGFFREQGHTDEESFNNAARIFRGSTPTGGPFTKDLSYSKGFVMVYNFIQLAVRKGKLSSIPVLFCGKTTLQDIKVLAQLIEEGTVIPPRVLPRQFADLNALTAWMCYSSFLNKLSLERVEADYSNIL